ncbi:hypothetical protein ACQ5SK_11555 [Bradyrhizobium japonicum]
MKSTKLPLWLRFLLLVGVVVFAAGASLVAYRYYSRPVALTVAVGSVDGEAAKAMSAMAGEFVSANAPVRLKVIDSGTALEAAAASPPVRSISLWFAAMSATCHRRKPSSSSAIWSY